ncbi:cytochrome c [Campylobacter coli]|nr:cytochrome c [Campylobacter coli]EAJ7022565.1 cytochrome c [Campylobacter coli]EAW0594812.1 cytochrome c [Campylobacter coli]EGS0795332.1 cytochrome c [Campylobacter coli]ELJ5539092.1 c-type cytochrome [Campylobacter coli]
MGKRLSVVIGLFLVLFLNACSDDKEFNHKNQDAAEEIVQIEQNDEKTEFSDTNLPLPVDDEFDISEEHKVNPSVVNSLYKQKCASCHGEKGEIKTKKGIAIKNLSSERFIQRLQNLKDEAHNFLTQEQRENLAKYISKEK